MRTVEKRIADVKKRISQVRWMIRKRMIFMKKNAQLDLKTEHQSPSGKYRLEVVPYKTGKNTWNYTCGVIFQGKRKITEVRRNYSRFPFAFVENHPNGHDYLICGEDYQGQTIVELDTGKRISSVPHAKRFGAGFCWVKITPSPDGTMLAVEGCVWAAPYEVLIVDFTNPMDPPWLELHRESKYEHFCGWDDDKSCSIGVWYEARKSDGKPEHELTDEEMEEMDRLEEEEGIPYNDLWMEVSDQKVKWTRPQDVEIARKYIVDCLEWRKRDDVPIVPDICTMISKHLENLKPEDRTKLIFEPEVRTLLDWAAVKVEGQYAVSN